MRRLRELLFPLWYVAVRLATRPGRVGLVVVGIAGAATLFAGALAGSLVAEDRALAQALDRLPPAERGLRAGWFGVPQERGADYASLDRFVTRAVGGLGAGAPVRALQYRQTRVAGKLVDLGAIDGVGSWVSLRSGRLPRPCRSERCEVLQLAGSGPVPNVASLRLVRVGRGTLTSEVPFGQLAPGGPLVEVVGARFAAETTQPPFLVAEGVARLARAEELASIFRSYSWFSPAEPGSVRPWEVGGYRAAVDRSRSRLMTDSFLFDLTAPVEAVESAAAAGRVSARRLSLIGGEAAALVLAFAVLAAAGLRRDHDGDLMRMSWYGASSWQLAVRSAGEALLLALGATALGWTLGTAIALALAERAGSPSGAIVLHSVLSTAGVLWALLLAGAAALVLLAALRLRPVRAGSLSVSVADVAALGAVAAVAVGLARGETGATELAQEEGAGAFLLLFPALVAFAFAVALVRAVAPAFRVVERLGGRSSPALRIASLSLARSPGRPALVAGFLAVSLGLALFAATYRGTLERGQVDQARFAVPLDLTLRRELGTLDTPLDLAPLSRYEQLTGGGAVPLVRLSGSVSRLATRRGVTVLGIPAFELARLPGWRGDFAALPPQYLASRIGSLGPAELRGPLLPPDARELLLRVQARGNDVVLVVSIATARGRFFQLELGETAGPKPTLLRAPLPPAARGGRVVALTLGLTALSRETAQAIEGTLTLGDLEAERTGARTVVTDYSGWIGVSGIERAGGCCGTRLRYFVSKQGISHFRPPQVTDGRLIPAIASPLVARAAGPGGVLPIQRVGQRLAVRVVAVAERFPSIEGDFVVADANALATALNTDFPGSARADELWLRVPPTRAGAVEAALRKPPLDALTVESRRALEERLRTDPLARATVTTLAVAALFGLALALVGVLLAVTADLKDERGDLFDLEAQGAEPSTLRRHVHLRVALTIAIGLLGGVVLGAVLSTTAVDLVQLTASAELPEPPLLLAVDLTLFAAAAGCYLAVTALLVGTLTWNAFRAPSPQRAPVGPA